MILITGASGFVGRALASSFDRNRTPWKSVSRSELVERSHRFEPAAALVYLAAIAHRTRAGTGEREYERVNRDLAISTARKAKDHGVRRFVFVSTAKVMGDVSSRPWSERDAADPPDAYSRAKLQAEAELMKLRTAGEFEVAILRPPLVYGPNVRGNFRSLLRLADSSWPLPLAGANAPRSLIAVANLADAIRFSVEDPAMDGQTVFVSDGVDLSPAQLVRAMRREFGRAERLFAIPDRVVRNLHRMPLLGNRLQMLSKRLYLPCQVDASRIRDLGWRPPHDWPSQLAITCEWYRSSVRAGHLRSR